MAWGAGEGTGIIDCVREEEELTVLEPACALHDFTVGSLHEHCIKMLVCAARGDYMYM